MSALPLRSKKDVVTWIESMVNEIYDPCGLAQGLSIGMVDMGLIRNLVVKSVLDKWDVSLTVRFTSAGCFYFPFFEREIRSRIEDHQHVNSLEIEWDNIIDWTPDDLSEFAKAKFEGHTRTLMAAIEKQ